MNSLHLCDTFVDGEREWMCTLQTGLQDNSLSKLTADSLPPKCSEQIDKLMLDLSEKIDERNETLTQVGGFGRIFGFSLFVFDISVVVENK